MLFKSVNDFVCAIAFVLFVDQRYLNVGNLPTFAPLIAFRFSNLWGDSFIRAKFLLIISSLQRLLPKYPLFSLERNPSSRYLCTPF
jgi:hypothetical protein